VSFSLRGAVFVAAILLLAGCPRPLPPSLTAASIRPGDLPDDREELIKYADEEMKKDTVVAAENSLVAVEKAIGEHALTVIARDYDALWRAARACAWLAEEFTDKKLREQFAYHGTEYAKAATALQPKRVEGQYYLGINVGLSATTKLNPFSARALVTQVRDAAVAAVKLDEHFDHGGPLRLLGSVYAKAPPWPSSIGDNDEGKKYLSRAAQLAPDYPENHLLYGDALADDNKLKEAAQEYKQVIDAPTRTEYSHRLERWKRDATSGIQKLGRQNGGGLPFGP
jgi:hypothetical protein